MVQKKNDMILKEIDQSPQTQTISYLTSKQTKMHKLHFKNKKNRYST